MKIALISNPLDNLKWSDEFADAMPIPFAWFEAADYDQGSVKERIGQVMQKYFLVMQPREIGRICDQVFSAHGLSDGDNIPVNLRQKVFEEISERVAKHFLGLPHEKFLTAEELKKIFSHSP